MAENLRNRNISEEMENSFLDYAMSVIVARALPDVRDGLKPVHRRILYSMYEIGLYPDKAFKKCARVVGDVLGKYHPHGDSAVYETMVRMAQNFSYRYTLVNGHGNFGSIDGDSAAAMRYTECKLDKISMELLRDINKDTVNFGDNYDGSEREPLVLPSRFPNLLVSGATGIAVGMATNIPPHNLNEAIDSIVAYMDNNDITLVELMQYIKGPDFPTGGTILGTSGIRKAYESGRGIITVRAKSELEESKTGKTSIIITEIPYQVNKSSLIAKIADLVRDKIIEGISDLRDESNRVGIRIVIELKREANTNVVLNNLFKHTNLQTSFGINLLALVDGQPRTLSLKEIIEKYVEHQRYVIIRRTKFELNKAEKRAHILEGLKIAIDNIDLVIKIIKGSKGDNEASKNLINEFKFSIEQAQAILEMKLRRLTGLEKEKIEEELKELIKLIEYLKSILESEEKVLSIIKEELLEIKNKYGDERRTVIDPSGLNDIEDESLIPVENIAIALTHKGYIKRSLIDEYKLQNRGGVGVKGITTNEEDFVENLISTSTHSFILFFSNKGKVYRLKGYNVPEYGRQAKGLPIVNLLQLEKDELIKEIISVAIDDSNKYLLFATKCGIVKKTLISEFESIRQSGKIAISLNENDELLSVRKTTGEDEVVLGSSDGRLARFDESEIRPMGRTAAGVRGINLGVSTCIGADIVGIDSQIFVITENGYGKRTDIDEYRKTHRGSKGVKTLNITEKNGKINTLKIVDGTEEAMIVTNNGTIIRLSVANISKIGRATQGVRLINLKESHKVSTVALIHIEDVPRETPEETIEEQK